MRKEEVLEHLEIANLADRQEYLEEVSKWLWVEWRKEHGARLDEIVYRSRHSISKDDIPQMLVAVYKGEAVGVVSIWRYDLSTRQDLCPWLATLYTKPEFRSMGVGAALQEACIEAVRSLGYQTLYLVTELENYYEKSGWIFIEDAPEGDGHYTKLYKYEL